MLAWLTSIQQRLVINVVELIIRQDGSNKNVSIV